MHTEFGVIVKEGSFVVTAKGTERAWMSHSSLWNLCSFDFCLLGLRQIDAIPKGADRT